MKVKDFSVSGEEFVLKKNAKYGFLETHPKPSDELLPNYYNSEDYISHTDSKRNIFENIYHLIRNYALKSKLNLINTIVVDGKTLLDIGCGTGDFLKKAKVNGWAVYGIEPNNNARTIANAKADNRVAKTIRLSSFESNYFDIITLWHVFEHLPDLNDQIKMIKKFLKSNGTLIVAVPNYKSFDARYYDKYWAAYDVPRHLWHFSKNSIRRLFSDYNFEVVQTKAMRFDSFYVSLLSEKYKSGKMNYMKGFLVGLISNIKSIYSKEPSSIIYILKNIDN